MSRPVVSRLMNEDEFFYLAKEIAGNVEHWLDRVHNLTAIDKPTLAKYASGERAISNTHALFIRQIYLLQKVYPDLASDITVLMRKPAHEEHSLPTYEELTEKASMAIELKKLKAALSKIKNVADNSIS